MNLLVFLEEATVRYVLVTATVGFVIHVRICVIHQKEAIVPIVRTVPSASQEHLVDQRKAMSAGWNGEWH